MRAHGQLGTVVYIEMEFVQSERRLDWIAGKSGAG